MTECGASAAVIDVDTAFNDPIGDCKLTSSVAFTIDYRFKAH